MAISFVANALGGTTTTTSFSITLPATQANDIIILEYTHRGTTDATLGGTYSGPAFTEKHDQQYATSTFSGKTLYSRASGNHSGQTVTGSGLTDSCAAIITVYRGALTSGDPLADATVVGEQNASGNETQAQITTSNHGSYVVLVVANAPDVAVSAQSCTTPGGLPERAERLSTGGLDTSIAHASGAVATAGATGAFNWAQTNGASGSWAYAIRSQGPPDYPNAWDAGQYQREKRNTTNRRLVEALLNDQNPPSPPGTSHRSIAEAFRTVTIQSRRSKSIGWTAALAPAGQPPPEVPAVSAWITPQPKRRRSTKYRAAALEPLQWQYIAPAYPSWEPGQRVIRPPVKFWRKLQTLAPQVELPPPVAPPSSEGFPAWDTVPLPPTFQDRFLRTVEPLEVYPETPKPEPNLCGRIPTGFHRRRETERRLLEVELNYFPAAEVAEQSDVELEEAFRTRRLRSRRLQTVPPIPFAQPAVVQEPNLCARIPTGFHRRRDTERRLITVELDWFPVTEVSEPSADAALDEPFRTRALRSRRLLTVPELNSYPATPAQQAQPITAVLSRQLKRAKPPRGLFMWGWGPIEARVTAQYPAYEKPKHLKRRNTKRALIRAEHAPLYTATPVQPQPISAWIAQKQHWMGYERTLQEAAPQITYPATPPPPEQPLTAWALPEAFRRFGWKFRRDVLELNEYPASPPLFNGPIPNISRIENTGTHSYDLSVYFVGATSYSIAPAIETGWTFNTSTAEFVIDTDAIGVFGPFVVTATNVGGNVDSNGFTVTVSALVVEEGGGGWIFLNQYESEQQRRRLAKKRLEELERETELIEDVLDKQIAKEFRRDEARAEREQELERLYELVRKNRDLKAVEAYSERVAKAYERVLKQGNFSALEALDREIARAIEEEDFLLIATLMILN